MNRYILKITIFKFVGFFFSVVVSASISDWNFTGLKVDKWYEYKVSTFSYRFNFRSVVSTDSTHGCTAVNCVIEEILSQSSNYCWCYGNLSTETYVIFPDEKGLNFSYTSTTPTEGNTFGRIVLECADEGPTYSASVDQYNVTVTIKAPQGCKGWKPPEAEEKKNKKSSIGFGVVFLIILLVSVFLYIVIAVIVQVAILHKVGLEILKGCVAPIIFFFSLIKDGCLWLLSLVKKSSKPGYDAIV